MAHTEDARIFALWLEPEEADAAACRTLIEELAQIYQSPIFDPHVTVFSGLFDELEPLKAQVDKLAGLSGPVTVGVKGFACTSDFLDSNRNYAELVLTREVGIFCLNPPR